VRGHNYGLCRRCNKTHINPRGTLGKKLIFSNPEERSRKISIAHRGKKFSAEHRKNISEAAKKRVLTPEGREGYRRGQLGRKHSVESIEKRREKLRGQVIPEEQRKKISDTLKRGYAEGSIQRSVGKLNGMFGKHHTEETRQQMSESHKGLSGSMTGHNWDQGRGVLCKKCGKIHRIQTKLKGTTRPPFSEQWRQNISKSTKQYYLEHPESIERLRQQRMQFTIRKEDTSIELLLQDELNKRIVNFQTHVPLLGQPDIFINPTVCIFADGCYWHGCPEHFPNNGKGKKDKRITEFLQKTGYIVLRFWGHEIRDNVSSCVDRIEEVM